MHQPGCGVGTDVGLGTKVVLLALTGMTYLDIAGVVLVLGRGLGSDDGRIHQCALVHEQTTFAQQGIDGLENGLGQAIRFQQMAKLEQDGGIGHRFAYQIPAQKAPKRLAIVDGIFQGLISQTKPLLQEIETQHQLQPDRRPGPLPASG